MDIRWLQDFLILAETGSFTRAAQQSDVSQAAFSRRIKTLEWWLGTVLVDRSATPLRLTPGGELFREQAAEIVAQIADAPTSFRDATMVRHQPVRLGITFASTARLPQWWHQWSAVLGPETTCSVVTGTLQDCITALLAGSVDMIVCHRYRPVPIALPDDQYVGAVIGHETLAPFASPAFIAAMGDDYPGRRGAPIPLLAYAKSCLFARVVDDLIENAPERLYGRTVVKTQTPSVIQSMAAAGHGLAWLTSAQVAEAPPGTLQRIDDTIRTAELDIVVFRDRSAGSPAFERLWELLARTAVGSEPPAARPVGRAVATATMGC